MFDLTPYWYRKSLHGITFCLLPFSWLFKFIASTRRLVYKQGILPTTRLPVPVIIVGNITVGGTGKTPFVIWLCQFLKSQGYKPGIVSRGVGGIKFRKPHWVTLEDKANVIGDEAVLLARTTQCPLVIGVNRVKAARELLSHANCDVIISDDGLQHYRLDRAIEIIMVDGTRQFGNQYLLPAGPLRESVKRLNAVDFIVVKEGSPHDEFKLSLEPHKLISLNDTLQFDLSNFPHKKVHAVAGIGNPKRFFDLLIKAGFDIIPHAFPDHYHFQPKDLNFNDDYPILMTEKDAVKCMSFATESCWFLRVIARIDGQLGPALLKKLSNSEDCYAS